MTNTGVMLAFSNRMGRIDQIKKYVLIMNQRIF